ncbi:MAG: ATP-dependent DNA ligase [Acidimicrobiales bacterium]
MRLPVMPPVSPMLAKAADELPDGDGWLYEPKWDGFRTIVFRDGEEIELGSRNERPMTRYFPEVLPPLKQALPERCVVDGELVVPRADGMGLDFDALQQRIHPAASRVNRLAAETPAMFIVFDVLAVDDDSLLDEPFAERRRILSESVVTQPSVQMTPATTDRTSAVDWFTRFEGAGLDGIVAKRLDAPYSPGERTMVKVKHHRTAECVVAGYRIHKDGKGVGSLLLGLYDEEGRLHHVGVAAAFTAKQRTALLSELEPLTHNALDDHPWRDWATADAHQTGRLPGAPSRWNATKDLSFVALRPESVVEVTFGQLQSGRFRHGVTLLRWRPDRTPESCTYGQLDVAAPVALTVLFG